MSRGEYINLEEARNSRQLNQFCKEHPSQADDRFIPLLEAMARGKRLDQQTPPRGASVGYSGTQIRQDASKDAGD